jgi:hypothetical protein
MIRELTYWHTGVVVPPGARNKPCSGEDAYALVDTVLMPPMIAPDPAPDDRVACWGSGRHLHDPRHIDSERPAD